MAAQNTRTHTGGEPTPARPTNINTMLRDENDGKKTRRRQRTDAAAGVARASAGKGVAAGGQGTLGCQQPRRLGPQVLPKARGSAGGNSNGAPFSKGKKGGAHGGLALDNLAEIEEALVHAGRGGGEAGQHLLVGA